MNDDAHACLSWLQTEDGERCTRAEVEQLIGVEATQELFAQGRITENPWTGYIEVVRPTEDFFP
jgi:hypothetical protein